jgi:hypothetical protein
VFSGQDGIRNVRARALVREMPAIVSGREESWSGFISTGRSLNGSKYQREEKTDKAKDCSNHQDIALF